jgi:hypothetical protein
VSLQLNDAKGMVPVPLPEWLLKIGTRMAKENGVFDGGKQIYRDEQQLNFQRNTKPRSGKRIPCWWRNHGITQPNFVPSLTHLSHTPMDRFTNPTLGYSPFPVH